MSIEEALAELQEILGRGLYPLAIPKVRDILERLKKGKEVIVEQPNR